MATKRDRAKDWCAQAEHTLGQAKWLLKGNYFDGACFQSQQAAEFALKALYFSIGEDPWGHELLSLQDGLRESIETSPAVKRATKELDGFYTTTRYANGFEKGSPKDKYTRKNAMDAIRNAKIIVEFCKANLDRQEIGHPKA